MKEENKKLKELSNIVQTPDFAQKINRQIGISNSISKIFQSPQWKNQISALTMHGAILKSIERQNSFNHFAGINQVAKIIAMQPKFTIPKTTINAINLIGKQHQHLFENLSKISQISQNFSAIGQIPNLEFALRGITGQIAELAASQKKWDLLDDFEEITAEAVTINDKIIDDEGITKKSINDLNNFLNRIEIKIDKNDKNANSLLWKLVAILSFILAITSETRNWSPKPEHATKKEIESLIKEQFSVFETKLKEHKEYRTTNRECKVMLKPRNKSLVLSRLPKGFDLIVLNVNHKWIYVSYLNSKDGLPQTGWVLKKYLSK